MTRSELVGVIRKDLEARSQWDTRQSLFYEMRHHGLRRSNKPWPNASDVHFPLCDSAIERLKPLYFQQLFASDQLATFVPAGSGLQVAEHVSAAALWFDHQVKHSTNFELEVLRAIDALLVAGRSVIKPTWDPVEERVTFQTIPAQQIIVPSWTREIAKADRIVHVQQYSPDAYRRVKAFRQGSDFEKLITGKGDQTQDTADLETAQTRYVREGLDYGDANTIVAWEIWTREGDAPDAPWGFETLSPLLPEQPIRDRVGNVYKHGDPPFVELAYEEKEAGWYSPRGVVEILATFEAELCKLMNEKNDALTLYNRPLFTSERDLGNMQNLRWLPGQILPFGIAPVQLKEPPISFDRQILLVRDLAERLINVPDFGMASVQDSTQKRTATEVAAIGQSSQQSADLRLRVFRMALAKLYRMTWEILTQYKGKDLAVWSEDRLVSVPKAALDGEYRIEPSGSADGLTRQQGFQKAVARLQLLGVNPFVDQGELTKTLLEADDAGLVKRLYRDPGTQAADGTEEQGKEIGVMLLGFPVMVSPSDNDTVHLQAILDYAMRQASAKGQASPEGMQMLLLHAQEHIQKLGMSDPAASKQFQAQFAALAQAGQPQKPGQGQAQQPPQPAPPGTPA